VKQIVKRLCIKYGEEQEPRTTFEEERSDKSEVVNLVNKAAGGNFDAFGNLYSIYLDRIYRYVYYHVKDRMMAEDITEEVFVKAWKAIRSCKGRGRTFSSWIYRIAHNHMINSQRNSNRSLSMGMEKLVSVSDRRQESDRTTEKYELTELLDELPLNQKQVLILKFLDGMSNNEIAKIMNKSEGAIRILQMRALSSLRQNITTGGDPYGA
jgi:RNA polymerase sigma-70 factor (ECF subfamily)